MSTDLDVYGDCIVHHDRVVRLMTDSEFHEFMTRCIDGMCYYTIAHRGKDPAYIYMSPDTHEASSRVEHHGDITLTPVRNINVLGKVIRLIDRIPFGEVMFGPKDLDS